eukprot:3474272-Rhodomonas_salina.3
MVPSPLSLHFLACPASSPPLVRSSSMTRVRAARGVARNEGCRGPGLAGRRRGTDPLSDETVPPSPPLSPFPSSLALPLLPGRFSLQYIAYAATRRGVCVGCVCGGGDMFSEACVGTEVCPGDMRMLRDTRMPSLPVLRGV